MIQEQNPQEIFTNNFITFLHKQILPILTDDFFYDVKAQLENEVDPDKINIIFELIRKNIEKTKSLGFDDLKQRIKNLDNDQFNVQMDEYIKTGGKEYPTLFILEEGKLCRVLINFSGLNVSPEDVPGVNPLTGLQADTYPEEAIITTHNGLFLQNLSNSLTNLILNIGLSYFYRDKALTQIGFFPNSSKINMNGDRLDLKSTKMYFVDLLIPTINILSNNLGKALVGDQKMKVLPNHVFIALIMIEAHQYSYPLIVALKLLINSPIVSKIINSKDIFYTIRTEVTTNPLNQIKAYIG